jgi:hypothetical protein
MKRLAFTQHTVRCPLEDRTASLMVRTDPDGCPSRRHLDVTACSLLPSTSFVPQGAAISRIWRRPCPTSARSIRPRATHWRSRAQPLPGRIECRRTRRRRARTLHLGGQ